MKNPRKLLFFIVLFSLSCSNKDITTNSANVTQKKSDERTYRKMSSVFNKADQKCHFLISSGLGADEKYNGDLDFRVFGTVQNHKFKKELAFGDLMVGESMITRDKIYSSNFNSSLSGQIVTVSLKDSTNNLSEFSVELYFPAPITTADMKVPNPLSVGSTITWNADSNNMKGVLLMIEYNCDKMFLNNPIDKEIFVEHDIGSYTFKSDDLKGMNTSSSDTNYAIVSIIRGDYAIVRHASDATILSSIKYLFASPWFITQTD